MLVSQDDAAQFFRLMWGLQFYVSRQRKLLPELHSIEDYGRLDRQAKVSVRDALWEHPELIDAYVQANPDQRSAEELELISKWKGFIAGKFFVFRYLKDYAILLGDSQVYGVKALYDTFDAIFHGHPLPIMIETVLLPYKGHVIYDGMCRSYNLEFGSGIRGDLKEQYMVAKQAGRILTSLEARAPAAKPLSAERKLTPETADVAGEIVKSSERLRGGTAIQSAAFGVLRASAKLAETAILQPEDLDEVERVERQVLRALNRLQRILERAEA